LSDLFYAIFFHLTEEEIRGKGGEAAQRSREHQAQVRAITRRYQLVQLALHRRHEERKK
jgi:hypothetical protein